MPILQASGKRSRCCNPVNKGPMLKTQAFLYIQRQGAYLGFCRGDAHFWLTYPPPLITSLSAWGGGDAQGGGGDARASCASPLGTPLYTGVNVMTAMKEANVVTQPQERLIMQPSTRATTQLQRLMLRPSHCEANVDLKVHLHEILDFRFSS